ncbi:MAG: adenylate/guanylate cyclase domain-containing protein [Planctomycetes bacterium]|nr:adenylate/guanylate cyclase domain-containing protein [Planctomycetota bacterium]
MSTQRVQKNLTVMFTDISGFTKHTETISREALMSRLDTHNELLMPIIAHFEGKIVKTIGDAFLITFESPTNAVQCGLFMQHTLLKYNLNKPEPEQIHIKVSINSGEVTVTETDVFGDPVNVAAKIEKATNPDEIYFTEAVFLAMNKSEVPTSFVKTFRPKGTDSSEIKLYKVAMDETDERYKKVIAATHIDKEKMKTRVLELSNLAEKEFVRYQDTLDALVESQGKSSRGVVVAVIAAALILAVAVIVAFAVFSGGGDKPGDQLASDVRAYLASGKPGEARTRVENYIGEHGADDNTTTLLNEIRDHEVGSVIAKADEFIASGQPEDARNEIRKYFAGDALTEPASKAMARADAYLNAREQISTGKAREAADALTAAFGDTNPSKEIRQLRQQADALVTAEQMMNDDRRFEEPMLMIGAISGAFGDDTKNPAAITYIEEGLANELFRAAKSNGYESANLDFEAYRKRFPNVFSWRWIVLHLKMGALWEYRTGSLRNRWSHSEAYWDKYREIRDYVADKPEKLYQFGSMQFMLARSDWQATCDGAEEWKRALEADPSLKDRHEQLNRCYRPNLTGDRAGLGRDLKTDLEYLLGCFTNGLEPMRDLIKKYYYTDLRSKLVGFASLTGAENKEFESERMNAVAILTDMGDAELIPDRFYVFREHFDDIMNERLSQHHAKALFAAPMTYEEYAEFRGLIDTTLRDVTDQKGAYRGYQDAQTQLQQMLEDIRAAQPQHTVQYDAG